MKMSRFSYLLVAALPLVMTVGCARQSDVDALRVDVQTALDRSARAEAESRRAADAAAKSAAAAQAASEKADRIYRESLRK